MISFEKRKALIREYPCFSALSEGSIEELVSLSVEEHYIPDQIIMAQGELVDSVYLIAVGDIEVNAEHMPQGILREGDAVGLNQEGFYSQTGLRTATLKAITEVVLIGWGMDVFHRFLEAHSELRLAMKNAAEKMRRMYFIKQAIPFSDLPHTILKTLSEEIEEIHVPEGRILFREGDEAQECYLICEGEVEIYLKEAEKDEKILAHLERWALFGESALLISGKRNAWARMSRPGKLLVLKREHLEEVMTHQNTSESIMALIIEHSRPTRAENIAHYHRENEEGEPITILKDKARGQYYQLSEAGWFVWQQLDGQKNLQDITIALYKEKQLFAPEAVADTVLNLADAGFAVLPEIEVPNSSVSEKELSSWERFRQKLKDWRYFQHVFYDIDSKITNSYKTAIHLFFTWPGQILMGGITLFGLIFFGFFLQDLPSKIPPLPHIIVLLFVLFLLNLALTVLHELAHAYTTKFFGHEVHRAGVIFNWLGLAAFVDTSDMWLSSRGPRILVNLAGPYVDLFLAGAFSMLAFFITWPTLSLFFWLLALMLYYSVFKNLNPIQETDGYYVLQDGLNDSRLRWNALNWLKNIDPSRGFDVFAGQRKVLLYWFSCKCFLILALILAFVAQYFLRPLLPETIYGISTEYCLWILPLLVLLNFALTLWMALRKI